MLDSFSRMTLEVILSTAFGVETDIQNDKESLLYRNVKEVFRTPWIMDILRRFPFEIYLLRILELQATSKRSPQRSYSKGEKLAKNWANRKTRFVAFDADSERGFN